MTTLIPFPGSEPRAAEGGRPAPQERGMPYVYPEWKPGALGGDDAADVLRRLRPYALWVGGSLDGPQATRIGDNRGAWHLRFGTSPTWDLDRKTCKLVAGSARYGLLGRYWCDAFNENAHRDGGRASARAAWRLRMGLIAAFQDFYRSGHDDFLLFDPDMTLGRIDQAVRAEASRIGVDLMSDREVTQTLRALVVAGRD